MFYIQLNFHLALDNSVHLPLRDISLQYLHVTYASTTVLLMA
jgi:hypothetical protein